MTLSASSAQYGIFHPRGILCCKGILFQTSKLFDSYFVFYAKDRHDGRAVKDNNVEKRRAGKATGRPRFHNEGYAPMNRWASTSTPSRSRSARRTTTTACAKRPRLCAAVATRVSSTSATTSSTFVHSR